MRTYIVGRSRFADIVIADATVDRRHAEVVVTDDGRHHLTDCRSEGGTWRRLEGRGAEGDSSESEAGWERIRQAFVGADEPLRLGGFRCTLAALMRQVRPGQGEGGGGDGFGHWRPGLDAAGRPGRMRGRVERDPVTGEIIRKRL